MRVLVTGAAGYIGSHFVKTMAERGHSVWGTDYNWNQNDIDKYCSRSFYWDIRSKGDSWTPRNFDKVVHIAALTKVGPSMDDPWSYYQTNVQGTKNLLEWANCDHFVYCSTGAAFQPSASPYATTKFSGEVLAKHYSNKSSIVRFYNVSGNDGMYKFDDDRSHLIRRVAAVANGVCNSMSIFGTDYDTRDGTCIRNYTHVKDIVDGLACITESEPSGEIDCLGSQKGVTVREVIDTMKKVSNKNFPVSEEDRRLGDIPVSTIPYESKFFNQTKSLEDMCLDALKYEV